MSPDLSMKSILLLLLRACPHDPEIDAAGSITYISHGHKQLWRPKVKALNKFQKMVKVPLQLSAPCPNTHWTVCTKKSWPMWLLWTKTPRSSYDESLIPYPISSRIQNTKNANCMLVESRIKIYETFFRVRTCFLTWRHMWMYQSHVGWNINMKDKFSNFCT